MVIFVSALEARDELVSILDGVTSSNVMRKPIDKEHFIQMVKTNIESANSGKNS